MSLKNIGQLFTGDVAGATSSTIETRPDMAVPLLATSRNYPPQETPQASQILNSTAVDPRFLESSAERRFASRANFPS